MIETVRLSQDQRNKLLKIRKRTGIKNWNVLCRWALCHSLAEGAEPPPYVKGGKTAIEIEWNTFAGKDASILYKSLVEKIGVDQFYSHLQRGIDLLLVDGRLNQLPN